VTLYFPQLADGGDASSKWQTTFTFVNPGATTTQVILYTMRNDGGPLTMEISTPCLMHRMGMPMKIVIFGPPMAGKGTQAQKLSKQFGIPQVSTGDLLRKAVADKTPMGLKVKSYLDEGKLGPDNLIVKIIKERVDKPDCKDGYILDGFPRTMGQARELEKMTEVDVVLNIVVDFEALVERAGGEAIEYGIIRDDLHAMRNTAQKALSDCDTVLITAGSSASSRDTTAEAISSLGRPGVLVHGINIRPGKPTILATPGRCAADCDLRKGDRAPPDCVGWAIENKIRLPLGDSRDLLLGLRFPIIFFNMLKRDLGAARLSVLGLGCMQTSDSAMEVLNILPRQSSAWFRRRLW
jgi:adenylate kinase family enzyme